LAVASCCGDQPVQVAHRIPGPLRRQVVWVGGAASGSLAGVDLDQLPVVEQLDQRGVGTGLQLLAQQRARHRIQRLGDLDVMVAVHLDGGKDRHVVGLGQRQQPGGLLGGEHLGRSGLDGAVQPQPRHLLAPGLGAGLASAKSTKTSPAKKLPRTYCTARSTRGLSLGWAMRVGSVANPQCWA
jgi:hypothetical protein